MGNDSSFIANSRICGTNSRAERNSRNILSKHETKRKTKKSRSKSNTLNYQQIDNFEDSKQYDMIEQDLYKLNKELKSFKERITRVSTQYKHDQVP